MDLRHLHHLLLLADELSFSRAAERAHLTQSAFSRSIQAAEALAGVKFFDRTQRSVKPTAVGVRIIERGRRILAEAKDLDREITFLEQGVSGHLRIGAGATVAASILSGVTAAFHRQHPQVTLTIEVSHWSMLRDDLLAERIDFFISDTSELAGDEQLRIEHLPAPEGSLFCRPEHPLLATPITRERLRACEFTGTPLPQAAARQLRQLLGREHDTAALLAVECNNMDVLRRLTIDTEAILVTLRLAVATELSTGHLIDVWPHLPKAITRGTRLTSAWGIVRQAGRTQSPAAARFMAFISQVFERSGGYGDYRVVVSCAGRIPIQPSSKTQE
ncbi:MAG: LysR family transcriptional regulator [Rhodocyclaceae bacterium]|nr:LysR family transcriptional regulator [Rhodocyclaceae bacterium]